MGLYLRMKRMGKLATLIIISLTLSLTIINSSLVQFKASENQVSNLENMFNIQNTYLFSYNILDFDGTTIMEDNEKIFNYIDKAKKDGRIYNSMIYDPYGPKTAEDESPKTYEELENYQYYNKRIITDWNAYKNNPIEIIRGRGLTKEDFEKNWEKDVIPVIVGIGAKERLNDTYSFKYTKYKKLDNGRYDMVTIRGVYEVVGVYKSKTLPVIDFPREIGYGEGKDQLKPAYEDTFMLFPLDNGRGAENLLNFGIYLELSDGILPEDIIKDFEEVCKKQGVVKYTSLSEGTSNVFKALSFDKNSILFLGIILWVLSILGAISIMLGHLMKRQLEIGVKQAIGASPSVIFKEVFKDMLFIALVSSFVSLYFAILINKAPIENWVLVVNLIISIITAFLISLVPMKKLNKVQIVDLLRKR